MTSRGKIAATATCAFLLGAALPAIIIWNPAGWQWAGHLLGRHEMPAASPAANRKQLWTCGMHPQVIKEEPGLCPICQMRLVPMRDSTASAAAAPGPTSGERKVKYWHDPMLPNFVSDQPGKSPMGMDLVPVYEDEAPAGTGVRVDPSFLQNFGVRTAVAEKGAIPLDIRTVGTLAHNERNIVAVNTKYDGWIEKSYFNTLGEHIKRGDLLFEIYSPQLVTTQKEYLAARQYLDKMQASGYADVVNRARSLVDAARERLRYWDISDQQVGSIERSGELTRTVKVYSPAEGVLLEKSANALEGMKLDAGMTVLKIADHSMLWAEARFYESQLRYVREGTFVRLEVGAFPGRRWSGRVAYFDPSVDPQTRTLTAFVEVDNRDLKLRPQMFADISVPAAQGAGAVRVPAEAVIRSGERSVVIVQKSPGLFDPREVELGAEGGGYLEIRKGVAAGETVVTSSQFLIDSEANLRAAINRMTGGGEAAAPSDAPAHVHP